MKVIVSVAELMSRGLWLKAVEALDLREAVNAGRVKGDTPLELTGEQAWEIGLLALNAYRKQIRAQHGAPSVIHGAPSVIEGAENVLPELDRMRENLGGEPMIPASRWATLRDYLADQIEADEVVHQRLAFGTPGRLMLGNRLSANRSTLARMRELEAGK